MERPTVHSMRGGRGKDVIPVDRTTGFGNPFVIGRDGSREAVIDKYREYAASDPWIQSHLHELAGKRIGCWCKPLACHADVLADMVEALE